MSTSKNGTRVVLVTGANRGIGQAIVQSLAQDARLPASSTTILLGCRNFDSGVRACHDLQAQGISNVEVLHLDVASDVNMLDAAKRIETTYGRLDVLVNNAGYAAFPAEDSSDLRRVYQDVYNINVTSVAVLTRLLLPLLRQTPGSKVVQIGSARGSLHLNAAGALPPTASAAYSVSKTALNMLTLDMAREPGNENIEFQVASPGHCKTAFNGYRGTRDPSEGANVVVELVIGERRETRIWETAGVSRELNVIPW